MSVFGRGRMHHDEYVSIPPPPPDVQAYNILARLKYKIFKAARENDVFAIMYMNEFGETQEFNPVRSTIFVDSGNPPCLEITDNSGAKADIFPDNTINVEGNIYKIV